MILNATLLLFLLASANGLALKGGSHDELASKGGRQLLTPAEYHRQQIENREFSKASEQRREETNSQQEPTKYDQQREEAPTQQQHYKLESSEKSQARYEAKPQVRDDAHYLAKGQKLAEVQRTATGTKTDEQTSQYTEQVKQETFQEESVAATKGQTKLEQAPARAEGKTEERREEQQQWQSQEQSKSEDYAQYEAKGQQKYEETKGVKLPPPQRIEEPKFEQERQNWHNEQVQQVELTKQDYEQRHQEDQQQVLVQSQEDYQQKVEESAVKGGTKSAPPGEAEPYAFDYQVEGSTRRETGDVNGVVRGQYTIQNPDGTQRVVNYVADRDGFRANVQTNEFGTEGQQPQPVEQVAYAPQPATKTLSAPQVPFFAPVPAPAPAPLQVPVPVPVAVSAPVPVPVASVPAPVPVLAPAQPLVEVSRLRASHEEISRASSAKGSYAKNAEQQFSATKSFQRSEEAQVVQQARAPEPVKHADLRTAKALHVDYRTPVSQARAVGFESATAHRHISHPTSLVPQHTPTHQLVAPVRSPVRNYHSYHHHSRVPAHSVPVVAGFSRSQLQYDRYPPAVPYRREQPLNPRVSFYANNFEEEHPTIGFEHSVDSSF